MPRAKQVHKEENGARHITFECPGCKTSHVIKTGIPEGWGFNENFDKPTFTPSVKVSNMNRHKEWYTVCHSFVTDGKIQFLTDSVHDLAGQTVDLPEIE